MRDTAPLRQKLFGAHTHGPQPSHRNTGIRAATSPDHLGKPSYPNMEMKALRQEVHLVTDHVKMKMAVVARAKTELSDARQKAQEAEMLAEEVKRLTDKVREAEQRVEDAERSVGEEIARVKEEFEASKQRAIDADNLAKELEEASRRAADAEHRLEGRECEILQVSERARKAQEKLALDEEAMKASDKERIALERVAEARVVERDALQKLLEEREGQVDAMAAQLNAYRERQEALEAAIKAKEEEAGALLKVLQDQAANDEDQSATQRKIADPEETRDGLVAKLVEMKREIAALQADATPAIVEASSLRQQVSELSYQLRSVSVHLQDTQHERQVAVRGLKVFTLHVHMEHRLKKHDAALRSALANSPFKDSSKRYFRGKREVGDQIMAAQAVTKERNESTSHVTTIRATLDSWHGSRNSVVHEDGAYRKFVDSVDKMERDLDVVVKALGRNEDWLRMQDGDERVKFLKSVLHILYPQPQWRERLSSRIQQ